MALCMALGLLACTLPILREAMRRLRADPERARPSRLSLAVELVPVHHPLERCFSCGQKIGVTRDGELMWLRVEGTKSRYLHQACADAHGEPLIPRQSRPGAPRC